MPDGDAGSDRARREASGFLWRQRELEQVPVVATAKESHRCGPDRYGGAWSLCLFDKVGTVRECRVCGRSWVAYRLRNRGEGHVRWEREGWLSRWRRHRRERLRERPEIPPATVVPSPGGKIVPPPPYED